MDYQSLVARLDNAHTMPSGTSARCPAHDDSVSSLMVNEGRDGGVVLKCHAGCRTSDILRALGLSYKDVMGAPVRVALYEYRDEHGELRYSVERWANPKTFRCVPGLPPPAQRLLYQAAALAWARAHGEVVYLVEGEKDVHTLMGLGLIATCNVGGAGAWLAHYGEQLRGVPVVLIADNDAPGRAHVRTVAAALRGVASTVDMRVPMTGKDVTDLIEAGYSLDGLDELPEQEVTLSQLASDVRVRSIEWAWRGYIPLAKLTIIEGDPGDGKSILTLDLAARWSTGAAMPDGTNGVGPWPVILVSAEDDPGDTIVPRLVAAGAKLTVVHLVTHGVTEDRPFDFATGLQQVEYHARLVGARAIVFDPLVAFIGGDTDTHNDASVRRALQPLKLLAERVRAAVLGVRHLNKAGGPGTKAIYRGTGSIAFTGAARATFLVTADRNDPSSKIFAPVKTNLSARPPSMGYRVEANSEGVPFIVWQGTVATDAQAALDGPPRPASEAQQDRSDELSRKREKRRVCERWLAAFLADSEPLSFAEIAEAGADSGFTKRQLRDALDGIHAEQVRGSEGRRSTRWTLQRVAATVDEPNPHIPISRETETVVLGAPGAEKWEHGNMGTALSGEVLPAATTDSERDELLQKQQLECEICHDTSEVVTRYFRPHWVVRCPSHNPFTYSGAP